MDNLIADPTRATDPTSEWSALQHFTFLDKYSRWLYSEGRRETFAEAVERSMAHADYVTKGRLQPGLREELKNGMLTMEAFPSMRWFQNAGAAARRHPQSIYNCSYMPVLDFSAFYETMFLLGLGVGVGYSVERLYVNRLPQTSTEGRGLKPKEIVVADSLEGWCEALDEALHAWWVGRDTKIDYSQVRPAGSPLITRGGTASGPEPLEGALNSIKEIVMRAGGRQLRPIEVHDIQCFIASAIVSGGHRRSAMISLFDVQDREMMESKSGEWYKNQKQRGYANNSGVINRAMSEFEVDKYMQNVFDSYSGEPGIFSRWAANNTRPERRNHSMYGTNPCGEVVLNPWQFCNLSIANVRPNDTIVDLQRKVRLAAIWGTIMACVDDFNGLRDEWRQNQSAERLLGVDLNGQRDCQLFNDPVERINTFSKLMPLATQTNFQYSRNFGIRRAAAVTCAKPAGNSSTFFDTASGIHGRFAPYYIRRVQCQIESPVSKYLIAQGVHCEPLNQVDWAAASTVVFDFYVKSPQSAAYGSALSAVDQLDYWRDVKMAWCEHNPSCTIMYRESERKAISDWVFKNQRIIGGISFLPIDDHIYPQAPYQPISEGEYHRLRAEAPQLNWGDFARYDEMFFNEEREYACVGGACDITL